MQLIGVGISDRGPSREVNEDSIYVDNDLGLYIVCDGMGGHAAGDVASKTAIEVIAKFFKERIGKLGQLATNGTEEIVDLAEMAVREACLQIYKLGTTDKSRAGMGTTVTMFLAAGNKAVMAHVGDSRLFLNRGVDLFQLSQDHTLVNELLSRGSLTAAEAKKSPYQHVLTRAVGTHESVDVDTLRFDVLPGDTYLICSDGLNSGVEDREELSERLEGVDLEEVAAELIGIAKERDGSDNLSAVLIRAESDADTIEIDQARSEAVSLALETLRSVYMFSDLDHQELVQIVDSVLVKDCPSGSLLVQQGDRGDCMYVMLSGKAAVSRDGKLVNQLEAGSHFGEMALLSERTRSATVEITKPSRLLRIEREKFSSLVQANPRLGTKLLWSIAREVSNRLHDVMEVSS